jgi:hypothetical protein
LHPDYPLQPAAVNHEIAGYYLLRHEFATALEYARRATNDSHAGWAQLRASYCLEGLQQWAEAESLQRTVSEDYNDLEWYFFTRRTGQGDAAAAGALANTILDSPKGERLPLLTKLQLALLLGEREQAFKLMENSYLKQPTAFIGLHAALLADEHQLTDIRDTTLKHVVEGGRKNAAGAPLQGLFAVAEAIQGDLAAGGKGKLDLQILGERFKTTPPSDQPLFQYAVGCYLMLHGAEEDGRRILLKRMSALPMSEPHRTLAGAWLVKRGIAPSAYQEALQTPVEATPPDPEPVPLEEP